MFVYTLLNWEVAGWCHSLLLWLHGHGHDVVDNTQRYVSRAICCLQCGRTYICRCQYGPVIWLALMSLSATHARALLTTEPSPCVTVTESPCHSKCSRGMRWLLLGSVHLGYCICPVFSHCSLLRYITMNHALISPVSYVSYDISYRCMCVLSMTPSPWQCGHLHSQSV